MDAAIKINGAEANLYTFREQPVSEGIQICFRTLYFLNWKGGKNNQGRRQVQLINQPKRSY